MTFLVSAIVKFPSLVGLSDCIRAAFAGADADRLLDGHDEDLAVADPAGMGGLLDRLDGALDHRVFHDHLDLHLGQEIDDVFRPAVELGDALDPDLVKRLLHLVELEGLDDRLDLFHRLDPRWPAPPLPARWTEHNPCQREAATAISPPSACAQTAGIRRRIA